MPFFSTCPRRSGCLLRSTTQLLLLQGFCDVLCILDSEIIAHTSSIWPTNHASFILVEVVRGVYNNREFMFIMKQMIAYDKHKTLYNSESILLKEPLISPSSINKEGSLISSLLISPQNSGSLSWWDVIYNNQIIQSRNHSPKKIITPRPPR